MDWECLRVGFGTDVHVLRSGTGVTLGGVVVPCAYGCEAVSDGDVVLHALVDAMLGCAGLGDIGEYFPAGKATPGESSARFVRETLALLGEAGVRLVNVDCVIDVEVVRLGKVKGEIRASVAALLGVDVGRVNVKAKTGEGVGAVGEGRAVSAQAVVLAVRSDPA